jgi:signal peptide peptidase SppA
MLDLIPLIAGRPWAIHDEIATHVRGIVAREGIASLRHLAALKSEIHAARSGQMTTPARAVAVIPVVGTLTQRAQAIRSEETRSTAEIAAQVAMAVNDSSIDAVVLDIDSPGGEVFGVQEAWDSIRAFTKIKPVIASANAYAASAAYWLATAADEILITPSGMVGSIGVYALHIDESAAMEKAGEKWTFVSAGKYKMEGNPAEPLSDEARADIQRRVDGYYDLFVAAVAKGRGRREATIRDGFGEGRMVRAQAAVEQGMADAIGTLGDAIRRASRLGADRRRQREARARQKAL